MRFYTYTGVRGNKILHRFVEDGVRQTRSEYFNPTLYVKSEKKSELKTLLGEPVSPINFNGIVEAKEYIDNYSDIHNYPIYGEDNFEYQFISDKYTDQVQYDPKFIKGFLLDIEVYTPKSASYGFPKPEDALSPIVSISLYNTLEKNMVVYGTHPTATWSESDSTTINDLPFPVKYIHCENEKVLLNKFIDYWCNDYPDYISAWNGDIFDFPYITNRIENVLGEEFKKALSPFGVVYKKYIKNKYGVNESVVIKGVSSLDYMAMYKKHTFITRASYALDYVAQEEQVGEKLHYDTDINTFYEEDYQGYIDYNIHDTALIYYLDEKLKLFDITFALAYYAKVNYVDTLGTVKIWEILLYHFLNKCNVVPPISREKSSKERSFDGAYVKIPTPGAYKWVVSVDLNSLYPHLIQQYNLGAETIIDDHKLPSKLKTLCDNANVNSILSNTLNTDILKGHPICVSANGHIFKTDKISYLSSIMRDLYSSRKQDKSLMKAKKKELESEKDPDIRAKLENEIVALDMMQMAKKILLNGGYGAIGNTSFKFFDLRIAEAITLGGQLSIKWIGKKLDLYFNKLFMTEGVEYVIYQDTDSCYIVCDKLVNTVCPNGTDDEKTEFLDKAFKNKILPYISSCYGELAEYLNCIENRMFMEREIIAPHAIWAKKKRYTAVVTDEEGVRYKEPKHKIMGLEAVRSEYPKPCREVLKRCYKIALVGNNDELIKEIEKFRKEYYELSIEDISFATSCNNMAEYSDPVSVYSKGTPIGVKAALVHNKMVDELGLEKNYEKLRSGEKIRFVLLKNINPTVAEVMGYMGELPKEFELESYIDKKAMFEKGFLKPLKNFLRCINWDVKKRISLEDYF